MQLFKFRVSSNHLKESSDNKEKVNEKEAPKDQLEEKGMSESEDETSSYSDIDLFLEESRFEEAVDRIDELLEHTKEDSMLWYKKGEAFKSLKRFKQAILCYNEAVEISPMFEDAWYEMGVLLFKLNELEKARECFAWILVVNPESSKAKKILSNLSKKLALLNGSKNVVATSQINGERKRVRRVIKVRKKVTLKPKNKITEELDLNNAFQELDTCINQLEEEMMADAPEISTCDHTNNDYSEDGGNLGDELLPIFEELDTFIDELDAEDEIENIEIEEIVEVEKPIVISDTSVQDLIDEARDHLEKKDFNEALKSINKALEKDTQQGDAWSTKGDVFMEMGQIDDASTCYKKAIVTSFIPSQNGFGSEDKTHDDLEKNFEDIFSSLLDEDEG